MNELRFVAACLQGDGRNFPTLESVKKSTAEARREAEESFHRWLASLPEELTVDAEDAALSLTCAWMDESFERGFIAGMRLMCQVLTTA